MPIRFDDSLPILANIVAETLDPESLAEGVVLRDATGRLAFFAATPLPQETIDTLAARMQERLGAYARTDRPVVGSDDYGADVILRDGNVIEYSVDSLSLRLVDRRLVGADWLRRPVPSTAPPPRFVFSSLKGGVGRSTALAIAAADSAFQGRRVLAIDLDLEAPGLGSMLLSDDLRPEFGVVDALVENGLSGLDEAFLSDLVGPSGLAGHRGRVDVMPAFGRRSLGNPADILSKIARAYTENVRPDGTVLTIMDQVRDLVEKFSDPHRYDAIFIDARAGLHETTASAILGLGAEVFLFGLDEPQTFEGYRALLAHLSRFVRSGETAPEWLSRLTMVHAKAPLDPTERADFGEQCLSLFRDVGLFKEGPSTAPSQAPSETEMNPEWNDSLEDEEVLPNEDWKPRKPLAILDDDRFRHFSPLQNHDVVSEGVYRDTFGQLLNTLNEAISVCLEGS